MKSFILIIISLVAFGAIVFFSDFFPNQPVKIADKPDNLVTGKIPEQYSIRFISSFDKTTAGLKETTIFKKGDNLRQDSKYIDYDPRLRVKTERLTRLFQNKEEAIACTFIANWSCRKIDQVNDRFPEFVPKDAPYTPLQSQEILGLKTRCFEVMFRGPEGEPVRNQFCLHPVYDVYFYLGNGMIADNFNVDEIPDSVFEINYD